MNENNGSSNSHLRFIFDWPQHFKVLGCRMDALTNTGTLTVNCATVGNSVPGPWRYDNCLSSLQTLIVLPQQGIGIEVAL